MAWDCFLLLFSTFDAIGLLAIGLFLDLARAGGEVALFDEAGEEAFLIGIGRVTVAGLTGIGFGVIAMALGLTAIGLGLMAIVLGLTAVEGLESGSVELPKWACRSSKSVLESVLGERILVEISTKLPKLPNDGRGFGSKSDSEDWENARWWW